MNNETAKSNRATTHAICKIREARATRSTVEKTYNVTRRYKSIVKNVTMEKLGIKNTGLLLFGIILLAIGLFACFYSVTEEAGTYYATTTYPYQSPVGIILTVAGIVLTALGLFFSPKRTEQIKQNA
jgi:uncharacterized membrane protein